MAQTRLITDLVSLVTPSNDDVLVIVDNTTNPSLSETKKISYANLRENLQDMIDVLISGDTVVRPQARNAVVQDAALWVIAERALLHLDALVEARCAAVPWPPAGSS